MIKENILKKFKELKEKGLIKENFETFDELINVLSHMFAEEYDKCDDFQDAFNNLNDYLEDMLQECLGVYTIGTRDWEITYSSELSDEYISEMIQDWNNYSVHQVKDIEELSNQITYETIKNMSNCGCDVFNALNMLVDEIFGDGIFYINYGELNPRISFLEI